ncbi:MAG: TlyA family RNA methyltransferase [Clostridiales bacterium]|nr:TlyA family RNA methyltransferase [Clostridiales bacterium]
MGEKNRLDSEIMRRGLADSREKGKALIMAGQVYVNGQKALKSGLFISERDIIEVKQNPNPFVSRGGLKLKKAVDTFGLSLRDKVCIDVGASTGGFTDCMLQNGASKVYAVDVGYGQLAWKLRTDERVVNLERTNFRYVTNEQIPEQASFASVDVSFISLKIILPVLREFLKYGGEAVCLIKPQFEAGRENVGKKGVVRDVSVHADVIKNITGFAKDSGFGLKGLTFSPVKGPEGNIEYLMFIEKTDEPERFICDTDADMLARESHLVLSGDAKGGEGEK